MRLAAHIQHSMLPGIPANIPAWKIDYHFQPMSGISGDLIDIYTFGDEFFDDENPQPNTAIFLADATGHGVSAALITMIARQLFFRAHRDYRHEDLASALFNANVELKRDLAETGLYLSAISIQLEAGGICYVNGGHPGILWFSRKTHKVYVLPNDGFLFGIEGFDSTLRSHRVRCEPGDVFIAYTDGVTEARCTTPEGHVDFGVGGITHAVWASIASWDAFAVPTDAAARIKKGILAALGSRGAKFSDDVTFVVMCKS